MSPAWGQTDTSSTDSLKVYRKLEEFARKKKITYRIYRSIFRPIIKEETRPQKREQQKSVLNENYNGKIIRSIHIETTDPFGYSLEDTSRHPLSLFQKGANKLHLKTKAITIKNIILLRKNRPFNDHEARESERLIRETGYIKEVKMEVRPVISGNETSQESDSVDIFIRALDLWSITGGISYSPAVSSFHLRDRNFLGLGNDADNYASFRKDYRSFETIYSIPTISNTHIITTFHLRTDDANNLLQSISFNRPFYSPLTLWAGGIFLGKFRTDDYLYLENYIQTLSKIRNQGIDTWLGRSWPIQTNGENHKSFVISGRYVAMDYSAGAFDTLPDIYADRNLYLFSTGIVTRNYISDNYLFKFGETEDIPSGSVLSLTAGKEFRNRHQRLYAGAKWGRSYYMSHGDYLNVSVNMGIFLRREATTDPLMLKADQSAIITRFIYITPLLEAGKWRFRNFLQTNFTVGFNRDINEALKIYNDTLGIKGFQDATAFGNSRLTFTSQFQSYAPYNILGFRFGPVAYLSGGFLSSKLYQIFDGRFYSAVGLGLLIRNEFLVLSNFEVSFAYYPVIPGVGRDVIKYRPFTTTGFFIEDFRIERPEMVPYR